MGNTFGHLFRITTFGESHGGGVGVVIDGCPPQLEISEADLQFELDRRRPGQSRVTTPRDESDTCEILSGVFQGKTLGTPIAILVRNKNTRPQDYDEMATVYRPSHADATYDAKYGIRNWQGGGRSSARETIGRVAAGAIAKTRDEDLALGGTALALEVAAGEAAGRGVFVAVVAGEREEVLAGAHGLRGAGGDEDVGLADVDVDRAARELGDRAGGEGHAQAGHGDIVFLIHFLFGWCVTPAGLPERRAGFGFSVSVPSESALEKFRITAPVPAVGAALRRDWSGRKPLL